MSYTSQEIKNLMLIAFPWFFNKIRELSYWAAHEIVVSSVYLITNSIAYGPKVS